MTVLMQQVVPEPSSDPPQHGTRQTVLGNPKNFWLWNEEDGFDLTHPDSPTSDPVGPRIHLEAYNAKVIIAPQKTALIVIDFQNNGLSQPRFPRGPAHDAEDKLLELGIPAARKAGIQVIWLNWGLADEDLEHIDPSTERIFAFHPDGHPIFDEGFGHDIGPVKLANGEIVQGGRFLMKDQWNSALHGPCEAAYQESLKTSLPDVKFNKVRISGMCDVKTDCTDYLVARGIKTLLFAGCNTDMCVLGTLQDASLKGFDMILLKDATGTTNGEKSQWAVERNCRKAWGFLSSCQALDYSVHHMK